MNASANKGILFPESKESVKLLPVPKYQEILFITVDGADSKGDVLMSIKGDPKSASLDEQLF